MNDKDFNDLTQGIKEAIAFANDKPVSGMEVETFMVKRCHSNQLKARQNSLTAEQIKHLRLNLGLSQADFAQC